MPETLSEKKQKITIAEVVRHGEKITIPNTMKITDAILVLQRRAQYDDELVLINHKFDCFVWDGAYALYKAMEKKYGWANMEAQWGWLGPNLPQLIGVEVERGKTVQVPWGTFRVAALENAELTSGYTTKDGRLVFQFSAKVKRKFEDDINELRSLIKEFLKTNSIYKGKAISIKFRDSEGDRMEMPEPSFLNLEGVRENELIFPEDVDHAIRTNLFTPIERIDDARNLNVPIKRGVLLVGDFGVGKTLSAHVAAKKAVENGITFVYCQDAREFSEVMRFATQYSPAVVFCEDIDKVAPAGETSSTEVDDIINTMDGVDTKSHEIITVLTTNEVKKVNLALIRPGRLDAVIHVRRPDADAVARLVCLYGGKLIDKKEDLSEVGRLLADNIPAVIREVVERSKLSALRLSEPGVLPKKIPAEALVESAKTMNMQLELLRKQHEKQPGDVEKVAYIVGNQIAKGITKAALEVRKINLDLPEEEILALTNGKE
jgi:transitional endoplasmic reticulum ATPase